MPKNAFRSITLALTAGLLMQAATGALPAMVNDQQLPSLAPLVSTASPAVVSIATSGTVDAPRNPLADDPFFQRFFGAPQQQQRQRQVRSAGSGVIIDAKNGYILTNHHVIEHADEIEILFSDKHSLKATVVGSDPGTDIAVLQIDDTDDLVQMPLGNSEQVLSAAR